MHGLRRPPECADRFERRAGVQSGACLRISPEVEGAEGGGSDALDGAHALLLPPDLRRGLQVEALPHTEDSR